MARREDDAKKMERMPIARGQQSMLNPQRKNDGTTEQAHNFSIRSKWLATFSSRKSRPHFKLIMFAGSRSLLQCAPRWNWLMRWKLHLILPTIESLNDHFQTIDPAQFAAYNSIECVFRRSYLSLLPLTSFSVGSVFKLTVHVEPDLGLGMCLSESMYLKFVLCVKHVLPCDAGLNLVRSDLWEKTSGTPSLTVHAGSLRFGSNLCFFSVIWFHCQEIRPSSMMVMMEAPTRAVFISLGSEKRSILQLKVWSRGDLKILVPSHQVPPLRASLECAYYWSAVAGATQDDAALHIVPQDVVSQSFRDIETTLPGPQQRCLEPVAQYDIVPKEGHPT